MYHYFQLNRDEFMEHYHKRTHIEATNAAIKSKFGETLKSKNSVAQVNELLAKIIDREVDAVKMNSALCASFVCFVCLISVVIFVINTQILERTINCKAHKEHKEI